MTKSMNLVIQDFREGLVNFINSYELPLSVKEMVMDEAHNSIKQANAILINQERIKSEKEGTGDDKKITSL